MNARLHATLRYLYALVLVGSGAKHLYNIYWGDASIMATGYPEPEAQAFVMAVLETKFLLPFICTAKLIAGIVMVLPGREQLGVLMAFPYAIGMLMWGLFMVPSHLFIHGTSKIVRPHEVCERRSARHRNRQARHLQRHPVLTFIGPRHRQRQIAG